MANLFFVSAAQVVKDLGDGPHSAASLLAQYGWTFTRPDATTCRTYWDKNGILQTAAANMLAIQYEDSDGDTVRENPGFAIDGSRINVVLWNRDLTNAAWVKSGGGGTAAVKDQTGIDGVASSASKLTASGANGTCLQSITLGSSQRAQFCYVKRLVGSGTINMTMDNGSTWTVITTTTAWTKVTIPSQTLANPIVGFRIVTSGDAIAVDYVQNENGAFDSPPIPTTTVAVTRAGDSLTFLGSSVGLFDMTVFADFARPVHADSVGDIGSGVRPGIYEIGVAGEVCSFFERLTRDIISEVRGAGSVDASQARPAGARIKTCAQYTGFTSAIKSKLDVGAGFGAFSATTTFSASGYGTKTVKVGTTTALGTELYGVLFNLKARAGLVTLTDIQIEPSFAPMNPFEVTDLVAPGPLISKAQSGRVNLRGTQQIGMTWTEHYLLQVSQITHREFLARMEQYWGNGTIFAKGHVDYATMKGAGGGVPLVKGASQTGSSLIVDGCPLNTSSWLRAGDIFRVQGLSRVFKCAADVNTESDGTATISLTRPIFTGGSPSDNAGLTITGVTLDVVLLEPPDFPTTSGTGADWGELTLKLSEAL